MSLLQACCILLWTFLLGCSGNPYATFYQPSASLKGQPAQSANWYLPTLEPPHLVATQNMQDESERIWEQGYNQIGVSNFNASSIDSSMALEQAARTGAAIVVVQKQFAETLSGTVPMTVPTQNYSTTTFNANGMYGTAQTTTYSNETIHVPYSVDRYNYVATFWARSKPQALGTLFTDLPDTDRVRLQRNTGVKVAGVRKGSPAFISGVLKGDVIVAINQDSVLDKESARTILKKFAGQMVEISIIRNGQDKKLSVQLNDPEKNDILATPSP